MYRFERITKERLTDVSYIFKSINKYISVDYFIKKFDTEIFGAKMIGFIAYDVNNEPSGYYGVFPLVIQYGDQKVLTAQSGDTITHPKHQGKGLFTKLATLTYELAKKEGIHLIWGFPNSNSYPGFIKKLNWVDNGNLVKVKISIRTLPILKIINKMNVSWVRKEYNMIINKALKSDIRQFTKANESNLPFILKDPLFFEYKNYNLNRFIVGTEKNNLWVKVEDRILIGDTNIDSYTEFEKIWKTLKKKCKYLGINEVNFICSKNNPSLEIFKKLDNVELKESLPFCFLSDWDNELAKNLSICLADFDTF